MWKAGIFVFYLRVAKLGVFLQSLTRQWKWVVPGAGSFLPQSGSGPLLSWPPVSGQGRGWGWGFGRCRPRLWATFPPFPKLGRSLSAPCQELRLGAPPRGTSRAWFSCSQSPVSLREIAHCGKSHPIASFTGMGGCLKKKRASIQARVTRVARRNTNHCTTNAGRGQPAALWSRYINRPK